MWGVVVCGGTRRGSTLPSVASSSSLAPFFPFFFHAILLLLSPRGAATNRSRYQAKILIRPIYFRYLEQTRSVEYVLVLRPDPTGGKAKGPDLPMYDWAEEEAETASRARKPTDEDEVSRIFFLFSKDMFLFFRALSDVFCAKMDERSLSWIVLSLTSFYCALCACQDGRETDPNAEPDSVRFRRVLPQVERLKGLVAEKARAHEAALAEAKAQREAAAKAAADPKAARRASKKKAEQAAKAEAAAAAAGAGAGTGSEGTAVEGAFAKAGSDGSGAWAQYADDAGSPYWYCASTGESSYTDPSAGGRSGSGASPWTTAVDDQGYTYYYNHATGESSYEVPN